MRAVDRDAEDGPGPNGQVTYSIVSQHNKFTIDPNTGDLFTNAVRMMREGKKGRDTGPAKGREGAFDTRAWRG